MQYIFLLSALPACLFAITFKVEPSKSAYIGRGECITYNIPASQLVTGFLTAHSTEHHTLSAQIFERGGANPVNYRELKGRTPFSFLTEKAGKYDVCFKAVLKPPRAPGQPYTPPPPNAVFTASVQLSFVPDLFDEKLATEAKLRPVEADFFASEDHIQRVANELSVYLKNEEKLRDANEMLLDLITWLSFISIGSLLTIGLWQIYYLKKYFRAKKLI